MSSKRKNTKPIRVSDIFLQSSSNPSVQSGLPAVPPHPDEELPSSHEQGFSGAEQASSWQVTLSLPNKPQDPPTMVSPYATSNSKWLLSSSYGGKSSDDNAFDVLRGSPLTNGEHNDPLMSDYSNSRPFPKKTRKIRYKYHENSQVKYKCDVCHYCTNRSDHYKRHLITHSEEKPLVCLTCGYRSGRSDHFKRHLGRHGLSKEEISKQCEYNGIRSVSQHARNLGPLLQGENDALMFRVKCSTDDSSPTSSNASSGQATVKKFSCDICGYTTDRNSHFTRHVRTHSVDRPYNCEACGKQFKLDSYLKKHRCSVKSKATTSTHVDNGPDRPFPGKPLVLPGYASMVTNDDLEDGCSELTCATCGVIFDQQSDLATHTCHNLMETL